MPEFFEYDPLSGIRTDTVWSEADQEMTVIRTADVEPLLEVANAARNELGVNKGDIRQGWWLYASIPPIVQIQMRAKGINISDPDHQKRMIQEINEHYPHLKMTTGHEMGAKEKIFLG